MTNLPAVPSVTSNIVGTAGQATELIPGAGCENLTIEINAAGFWSFTGTDGVALDVATRFPLAANTPKPIRNRGATVFVEITAGGVIAAAQE